MLTELWLADPPARWSALGFTLTDARQLHLGHVALHLGGAGSGITAWGIRGIGAIEDIDGLRTEPASVALALASQPAIVHGNGALGLDHVVIVTPDFDRTAAALAAAGVPLRRVRELEDGSTDAGISRQGFRRLGPAILELVEAGAAPAGPARFWGLVVIVEDLEALAETLGDQLGRIGEAVQPGRRIATLRARAGLGARVAFMDPEPAALRASPQPREPLDPSKAIDFRCADLDAGPGAVLAQAMRDEIAAIYEGLDLDGDHMPRAGAAELGPPHGTFIVGWLDGEPVCCGGIKRLSDATCEIKKMYVAPSVRGHGFARVLLHALEHRAHELGYTTVRLDTGPEQPYARALYESEGYGEIGNFNGNPVATFFGEKRLAEYEMRPLR